MQLVCLRVSEYGVWLRGFARELSQRSTRSGLKSHFRGHNAVCKELGTKALSPPGRALSILRMLFVTFVDFLVLNPSSPLPGLATKCLPCALVDFLWLGAIFRTLLAFTGDNILALSLVRRPH